MSSVGQIVGGIVGAIVGFYAGGQVYSGAMYGASLGMALGGALDPPKGPHSNMVGPRLSDLTVQTSSYGVAIPRVRGKIATFGNVIWLQGNQLTEVATTTESSGGKGGGGATQTSTTFEYFATFAVGLCEGLNDGTSLEPATISAGLTTSQFCFYPGSDTQLPDPTIQADRGIASTPAYRGLAYLVFHNFPLKDYGNSLMGAQVKVEVIANGGSTHILSNQATVVSPGTYPGRVVVTGDYAYVCNINGSSLQVFNISDPAAPFSVFTFAFPGGIPYGIDMSGSYAYVCCSNTNKMYTFDISNPASPQLVSSYTIGIDLSYIVISGDYAYVCSSYRGVFWVLNISNPAAPYYVATFYPNGNPEGMTIVGNYAYVCCSNTNKLQVLDISNPAVPVSVAVVSAGSSPYSVAISGSYAYVGNWTSATLQVFDISNPLAPFSVAVVSAGVNVRDLAISGSYVYVAAGSSLWVVNISNPLAPFSVAVLSAGSNVRGVAASGHYAYVSCCDTSSFKSFFFADNIFTTTTPTLGSIVSTECLSSKLLTTGDIDVTDLTDIVTGYRVSSVGSIRAAIEPLRASWPFDVVQSGYRIKFKKRGSASVVTIPWDQLDARKSGDKPGVRVTNSREMDSILPCKVTLKHFDTGREYDVGEQYAERINTDAINVTSVDLPLAMTATEAAQKADALLYLYWLERYDLSFVLPPVYDNLEPGDSLTITTDDMTYNLRLVSVHYLPDGRLECAAKYSYPAVYVSQAVGSNGQATSQVLSPAGSTVYELLDIPCLQDAYNLAGFPLAMGGFLAGWPGGSLIRTQDLLTWTTIQGVSAPGARQGFATNTLAAHPGTMIDKSTTLAARIYQGTLSSITEGAMLNGGNHFAYGLDGRWEIIAAQNCVLQADGTYILSDFLRGRFGTEWATGQHAVGDHLVLLDSTGLKFIGMDVNAIGLSRTYRGITLGKDITTDQDRNFAYKGVNLECLSPVYLNGNRTANDWNLTWVRRTRVGGEWRDFVDATLGETTEAYDVEIYDSAYTTVKRTISVTTPAATYTSAQQVTDFGANQATLYLRIYQKSATVGRGYYLQTSITR
ncbi:MAG: phage tail protein [Deltaproteobacteria bacterium]|nr:phage tail protein [Deltaproteobacteria bacterium]